jgi:hypothetical protein
VPYAPPVTRLVLLGVRGGQTEEPAALCGRFVDRYRKRAEDPTSVGALATLSRPLSSWMTAVGAEADRLWSLSAQEDIDGIPRRMAASVRFQTFAQDSRVLLPEQRRSPVPTDRHKHDLSKFGAWDPPLTPRSGAPLSPAPHVPRSPAGAIRSPGGASRDERQTCRPERKQLAPTGTERRVRLSPLDRGPSRLGVARHPCSNYFLHFFPQVADRDPPTPVDIRRCA